MQQSLALANHNPRFREPVLLEQQAECILQIQIFEVEDKVPLPTLHFILLVGASAPLVVEYVRDPLSGPPFLLASSWLKASPSSIAAPRPNAREKAALSWLLIG